MPNIEKPPCPLCRESLKNYFELKKRLHNYFFHGIDLNITNTEAIQSYTDVYNLITNNSEEKTKNEKKYEQYEETFSNIFKSDLIEFGRLVKQRLIESKGMSSPIDELALYEEWIGKYTRFLHWTYKTFMIIEKNTKTYSKSSLFHQGLIIMRDEIIVPLYDNLFKLIVQNLESFKSGALDQYFELQSIIQIVGSCGFLKYKNIRLQKNLMDNFQFKSVSKQHDKGQIEYETEFFLRNFTIRMVKFLQKKYSEISDEMIQLSTSEYVNKAIEYLKTEDVAALNFYNNENVKNLLIRSIQQNLITYKSELLIRNEKTGLMKMVECDDVEGLSNLYRLTKRTSQQKIFAKYYQQYIEEHVQEQILGVVTPEEEKATKRQTVTKMIDDLYEFYLKMDNLTLKIYESQKDHQDLSLQSAQNLGFQSACNKTTLTSNFLVYYADNILKKEENNLDNSLGDLVQKISRITKFFYSLDTFLKLYQRLLGVRILYDTFKNRETEMEIINLMKNQVGVSSMTKINAMIADYKFSEKFNEEKVVNFKNKINFNMQAMILTSGQWQIHDNKNMSKLVPPELISAVQLYEKQYFSSFPGREVTWVFNYGRAIVQVKFQQHPKALLFLNNYQLLILLLLQRKNFMQMKIMDLISQLQPEEEPAFMASIMMLVKRGALIKSGNPVKIESKNDTLAFNFNLPMKTPKLRCFQIPKFSQKADSVNKQVLLDRNVVIQANIIKLMKAKRILRYQDIIAQVPKMCQAFKAEVGIIKNQIENCIHKDYLERDSKDINLLIYKP